MGVCSEEFGDEWDDGVAVQFSVLSSQFSVLSTQYSVLRAQGSVLSSQGSVLSTRLTRYSVLGLAQCSVLGEVKGPTSGKTGQK